MKHLPIIIFIFLYGCAAKPVTHSIEKSPTSDIKTPVNNTLDNAYNRLLRYVDTKNLRIRSQFKSETDASVRVEITDATITYLEKSENKLHDSTAMLFSEIRQRISNFHYVYPRTANVECVFTLNKQTDSLILLVVSFDKTCTATSYLENTFVIKRPIPSVDIKTTGFIENELKQLLN